MAEEGSTKIVQILEDLIKILKEEHVLDPSEDQPVVRFLHPKDLQTKLPVTLDDDGSTVDEINTIVREIIRYSVKTSSPHFHNQLYGGMDPYGLAGAWLAEALNTSQYTYEVAPVFILLERELLKNALRLVGYPELPAGDGIFCPGGSLANMYGMVLARYARLPEVKTKGSKGFPPLASFSSEAAHYSILKSAHWLGLGTESVYRVKTDERDRMDPEDLRRAVAEARSKGYLPFFVNATCGTTVLGSFDPLSEITAICKDEKLWLHVDACLGGTLLLSDNYRKRLTGIESSNSVSWNPHKMLGAPLQCSLFLTKGKDSLHEANSAAAKYLFQQDKFYDVSWDTGDKSVQCGRKVDALKLWLMWKARGTKVLGKSVDEAMSASEYFLQLIKDREGYRLVLPKFECSNVCFWYIPPSMRSEEETKEWWDKLYTIAPKIKERMTLKGSLMIGYTSLAHKNLGNFFRMVVTCQPPATRSSMEFVVRQIEECGLDL